MGFETIDHPLNQLLEKSIMKMTIQQRAFYSNKPNRNEVRMKIHV